MKTNLSIFTPRALLIALAVFLGLGAVVSVRAQPFPSWGGGGGGAAGGGNFDTAQFATNSQGKVSLINSARLTNVVLTGNATLGTDPADIAYYVTLSKGGSQGNITAGSVSVDEITASSGHTANLFVGTITAYASNALMHQFSSSNSDNVASFKNQTLANYSAIQFYNVSNTVTAALGIGNEGSAWQYSNRLYLSADQINANKFPPDLWVGHSVSNFSYPRLFLHSNGGFSLYPEVLGAPETNFAPSTNFYFNTNGVLTLSTLNVTNSPTNAAALAINLIPSQGKNAGLTVNRGSTNVWSVLGDGQMTNTGTIGTLSNFVASGSLSVGTSGTDFFSPSVGIRVANANYIQWSGRTTLRSPVDGVMQVFNNAETLLGALSASNVNSTWATLTNGLNIVTPALTNILRTNTVHTNTFSAGALLTIVLSCEPSVATPSDARLMVSNSAGWYEAAAVGYPALNGMFTNAITVALTNGNYFTVTNLSLTRGLYFVMTPR